MNGNGGRRRAVLSERGQTLLIFVLATTVLLGFTAMAIDIGMFFEDRRHLQNSADAMALAGVQELPTNPATAKQKARDWAVNNGISDAEIQSIEVQTGLAANDTVHVELEKDFNWIFARVLGKTSTPVGAQAAARTGSLAGGFGAMPWALLEGDSSCLYPPPAGGAKFGADCEVKVGAGSSAITGWYGALDYDGNGGGSSEYDANIIDNTTVNSYCVASGLPADCDAYIIDALSGNKVGGTDSGINMRLSNEPTAACNDTGNGIDDFNEVFAPNPGGDPTYTVLCPSPRLIILPIVTLDPAWPTNKTVTIEGWTLAYLKGYSCVGGANCKGGKGHWEVNITIVDAAYSQTAGFLSAFDPDSGVVVRRLIR